MKTWIFQGNPDRFDIDGYLAADLETITWTVRQNREKIELGDTVFIWKAQGRGKEDSGVIAECRVVSPIEIKQDNAAALPFWKKGVEHTSEHRVELLVIRVARSREVLKRDWLKADPVLAEMAIFKMAQNTNFLVTDQQSQRLLALWERTGKDWSWRESLAGLWAYAETKGTEVSKLPGSPVARVALATGRAVGGVYNKVMNFRAIDPSDERAGLLGASETDRKVWSTFCDPITSQIDRLRLDAEIHRLGLSLSGNAEAMDLEGLREVDVTGSLDSLLKRYRSSLASGAFRALPLVVNASTQTFSRNPLVAKIARMRATSKCEIPGCAVPPFIAENGLPFCEVHHVTPLSEGGEDLIENAICLCPVHHREAHHGKEKQALRAVMLKVRTSAIADTVPD